ncbi:MAG TPA: hypothetical protein VE617_06015 [Propionibacteriaceae bacterium]|nr:hypothetical protein [Propionibacteriaceae bacterium]
MPSTVAASGSTRCLLVGRGDLEWPWALRSGTVAVTGPEAVRRQIPVWFAPSRFAAVPRAEALATP